MEDQHNPEVARWVEDQNRLTFSYLEAIPFRAQVRDRLEQIWNYPRYSAPFRKGGRYYYYKNDGLQNQSILYTQADLNSEPVVFLDPNRLSADGTTSISTLTFSHDDKYALYGTSGGGSDWNDFYVMDAAAIKQLPDHLQYIKFSGAAWHQDGFYYSRYEAPKEGNALVKRNEFHKVYYHKVGTPQAADRLVHENKARPLRNFSAQTTEDERFLIISETEGSSSSNAFSVQDLRKPGSRLEPVISKFESQYSVVDNLGDKLVVRTSHQAPNYRLVLLDPANPDPKNWKELIPEGKDLLQSVTLVGNRLFALYL